MERIPIRITALLAMTTLAACDFLDIDTPGIVNRDKMFENEQGFIDAMNGVYASMADADLYGEQLSFGFVDEIAQLYYNDYEANETTLTKTFDLRYRDEDVRPQIDAIWSKAYNTIASANSVLDNISGHDFAILPRIRGEEATVEVNNDGVLHYITIANEPDYTYRPGFFKTAWGKVKTAFKRVFAPGKLPARDKYDGFVVFSKPRYKPGETVKFKAHINRKAPRREGRRGARFVLLPVDRHDPRIAGALPSRHVRMGVQAFGQPPPPPRQGLHTPFPDGRQACE